MKIEDFDKLAPPEVRGAVDGFYDSFGPEDDKAMIDSCVRDLKISILWLIKLGFKITLK